MPPSESPLIQLLPYIVALLVLAAKKMNLLGKAAAYMTEIDVARQAAPPVATNGNSLALATVAMTSINTAVVAHDRNLAALEEEFRAFRRDCLSWKADMLTKLDTLEKRLPPPPAPVPASQPEVKQ